MNNDNVEIKKNMIETLIDLASDKFPEIIEDKNASLVVLGTHGKNLVLEMTSFDPRIKKYVIEHMELSIVKKNKLVPEDKIKLFDPYTPE